MHRKVGSKDRSRPTSTRTGRRKSQYPPDHLGIYLPVQDAYRLDLVLADHNCRGSYETRWWQEESYDGDTCAA